MAHRKTERNPLFAGRWFEDDIILLCLRWYFRFKLSYRDLVAILGERGLSISHTTILRWVIRYAETCEKRWSRFERHRTAYNCAVRWEQRKQGINQGRNSFSEML